MSLDMRRPAAYIFQKKRSFCFMVFGVSAAKFLYKNTKNSWRTNFLKIISFCKNRSRSTALSVYSMYNFHFFSSVESFLHSLILLGIRAETSAEAQVDLSASM